MNKPKKIADIAEIFRTMEIIGEDYDRITSLGNVVVYQDGRKLCYQLYSTVIAERDLDTEQITFNFGGWFTQTTNNHLSKIAQVKPRLNYAPGWAWYEKNNIQNFEVKPISEARV
jgi:hypothetical protein